MKKRKKKRKRPTITKIANTWDLPDGPVVKNLPSTAGSVLGWGTKIPHAAEQLSLSRFN